MNRRSNRVGLFGCVGLGLLVLTACQDSLVKDGHDEKVGLECEIDESSSTWGLGDPMELEDDELHLSLSWGGGCGSSFFRLCSPGVVLGADGKLSAELFLHQDLDDPCEAIVRDTLTFDVSGLKPLAREVAASDHGVMMLELDGPDESPDEWVQAMYPF
jgi:hypothetical protein